jgi:ribosomal protein L29
VRNVLTSTVDSPNKTRTRSSFSAAAAAAAPSSSSPSVHVGLHKDKILKELDQMLQDLKSQYLALQVEYVQHASECRDMEALLRDMRTSLFNLRIAIQSFDDYEIQPIADTTQVLKQYQTKLQHYARDSQGTVDSTLSSSLFLHIIWSFLTL